MVNDNSFERGRSGLQFQSELVLQGAKNGRAQMGG